MCSATIYLKTAFSAKLLVMYIILGEPIYKSSVDHNTSILNFLLPEYLFLQKQIKSIVEIEKYLIHLNR